MPSRWTEKRRNAFASTVDDFLIFASLAEPESMGANRFNMRFGQLNPRCFAEAETFLHADGYDGEAIDISRDDEWCTFEDVSPRDLSDRFEVSICRTARSETVSEGDEDYVATFQRARRVPLKKVRGLGRIYSPYIVDYSRCWVLKSGHYVSDSLFMNWTRSGWVSVNGTDLNRQRQETMIAADGIVCGGINGGNADSINRELSVLLGVAFARDYYWRIVIKNEFGISFSLMTDIAGARAAFNHREVNEETGRRDALRHWVSAHHRKRRNSTDHTEENRVFVRKHLRGRTPFRWLGLDCELVVSPADLRENEKLADERKLMAEGATL